MWSASELPVFFFFRGKNWNTRLLSYTLQKRVRSLAVSQVEIASACVARWPRSFLFFCFYKEERSTEYLLLCWNTERQSLNNATSPQPITQFCAKSLRKNQQMYDLLFLYLYVYIFFNAYGQIKLHRN